jgi:hypothetical protein
MKDRLRHVLQISILKGMRTFYRIRRISKVMLNLLLLSILGPGDLRREDHPLQVVNIEDIQVISSLWFLNTLNTHHDAVQIK